jgi:hypothetical protein
LLLEETYPSITNRNRLNPLWRLINDEFILKFQQTQFYWAIVAQFATFWLAQEIINKKIIPSDWIVIFLAVSLIHALIDKGAIADWFKMKHFRIVMISLLWAGCFLFSYIYLK